MTDTQATAITLLLSHLLAVALGILIGHHLYSADVVPETYKPQTTQADGSVILERNPDATATAPAPQLPGKPERTVQVTVKPKPQPKPEPTKPGTDGYCPAPKECPALTVRLDLVKQADGRRVVASSPDGDIVGGIDVPLEPMVTPRSTPWAAGLTYDTDQRVGAFLDRDLGPFRLGIEADQDTIRARAGLRF